VKWLKFPTLDEAKVRGKTVLLRVDINSPVDLKTGEILDDTRIRLCAPTIKELISRGAKVVVLAHQGRPGDEDFISLKKHAQKLSTVIDSKVEYVEDVLGPAARHAIEKMRPGEILLLDNVRFCAEETLKGEPEEMSKTHLVQRLAKLADIYVNDAFAAAHRNQPSLIGFGPVLPTYAGRLMEKELRGLSRALNPEKPCVYILGGAKFEDSLAIIENVFEKKIAAYYQRFDAGIEEDIPALVNQQRGLASSDARQGRFQPHLEANVASFAKWYADQWLRQS